VLPGFSGLAAAAGITERTAQTIVADLVAAGYVARTRVGRRTRYTVNHDSLFRHPAQEGHRVGPFLALLATATDSTEAELGARGEVQQESAAAAPHAADLNRPPDHASTSSDLLGASSHRGVKCERITALSR
jgi:hypothetical protein